MLNISLLCHKRLDVLATSLSSIWGVFMIDRNMLLSWYFHSQLLHIITRIFIFDTFAACLRSYVLGAVLANHRLLAHGQGIIYAHTISYAG